MIPGSHNAGCQRHKIVSSTNYAHIILGSELETSVYVARNARIALHLVFMSTERDMDACPWVPDTSSLGARLALVRQRQRWNMKEAAVLCGFNQNAWRDWELDGRRPRALQEVCERIAEESGVDVIWLMSGRTQSPPPPAPMVTPRQPQQTSKPSSKPHTADVEVSPDALHYLALADGKLPRLDSNQEPFG
jgi:transcriptional regulator with XRE-family HTH domain